MPGSATNVGEKIAIDAITGRVAQPQRLMYLALLTAGPTDTTTMATMAELTTPGLSGYARQLAVFSDPTNTGITALAVDAFFGPFPADLGNVTHVALVSALTGTSGELVYHWTADAPRDPTTNDSIRVAVGSCIIDAN